MSITTHHIGKRHTPVQKTNKKHPKLRLRSQPSHGNATTQWSTICYQRIRGLEPWRRHHPLPRTRLRTKDPDLQRDIVKTYHDHITTGHPGHWKTYELVSREFWWPGISQFVQAYVDGCATCQSTKICPRTHIPLQPNQVPQGIWKSITMDFVTDLPLSNNYNSIFVTVDRFSKAIIITPCHKTITAEETTDLFLNHVWWRTGLPTQVILDRGPQFAAKVTTVLWKKLDVKPSLSTAFHPQTDGETKRVNQEIEQFLQVFCNFQQDNWSALLPFAEFAHNVHTHSATRCSPFFIWYGFQPQFLPPIDFASNLPAVKDRLRALEQICREVSATGFYACRSACIHITRALTRLDLRALHLPTHSPYSFSPFCSYDQGLSSFPLYSTLLLLVTIFLFHSVPVSLYLHFSFPFVSLSTLTHPRDTCAVPCTHALRLSSYLFISLLSLCLYRDMLLASPSTIQSIPYL